MWGGEWDIRRFDEVDSTNTYVREQARRGARAGLVAVADHQTAGRGRLEPALGVAPGSQPAGLDPAASRLRRCRRAPVHRGGGPGGRRRLPGGGRGRGRAQVAQRPARGRVQAGGGAGRGRIRPRVPRRGGRRDRDQRGLARAGGSRWRLSRPGGRGGAAGRPHRPVGPAPGRAGAAVWPARRGRRPAGPGRGGAATLRHPGPGGSGHRAWWGGHGPGDRHRRRRAPGRRDGVGVLHRSPRATSCTCAEPETEEADGGRATIRSYAPSRHGRCRFHRVELRPLLGGAASRGPCGRL